MYSDNGKENGNYYVRMGCIQALRIDYIPFSLLASSKLGITAPNI